MPLTPRERVIRTLEFDGPDRIPRHLWVLPWASDRYPDELAAIQRDFPDDIAGAPWCLETPVVTKGDAYRKGEFTDEWGCTFKNIQDGAIGEVKRPLVADLAHVDRVEPPEACLTVDRDAVNAFCRDRDRFVLAACCPRPFERIQFLRGTENVFMDLLDDPPEFRDLLAKIHGFHLREFELWAGTDVDGLGFMDDWGSQRTLLISPDLWRTRFKPLYREYAEVARASGKYLFMHSDGWIADIIPDLIEIGVNALNSQVFCMTPERLAPFAGRITFWGELDRQHLLPRGTTEEIREAARTLRKHLYRDGGLVAQCEFGLGARPENVRTFFETMAEPE